MATQLERSSAAPTEQEHYALQEQEAERVKFNNNMPGEEKNLKTYTLKALEKNDDSTDSAYLRLWLVRFRWPTLYCTPNTNSVVAAPCRRFEPGTFQRKHHHLLYTHVHLPKSDDDGNDFHKVYSICDELESRVKSSTHTHRHKKRCLF